MSEINYYDLSFFHLEWSRLSNCQILFPKDPQSSKLSLEMKMGLSYSTFFFSEQHEFLNAFRTQRGKIKYGCITYTHLESSAGPDHKIKTHMPIYPMAPMHHFPREHRSPYSKPFIICIFLCLFNFLDSPASLTKITHSK